MRTVSDETVNHGVSAGMNRRTFLQVGSLGALGWTLSDPGIVQAVGPVGDRAVILLMLVGGPSQLETWDPKPDAPAEVRGPFRSIATAVPGVRITEGLPRTATRLNRLTLIRSLHHDAAPIHETGQQLIQTGRLCGLDHEAPHFGAVAADRLGPTGPLPPFVVVPRAIGNTGVGVSHGQTAGTLGRAAEPFSLGADPASSDYDPAAALNRARRFLDDACAPAHGTSLGSLPAPARNPFNLEAERRAVRAAYGWTTFGQSCLLARRLVEAGTRVITVNMFETVFNRVTWDCHGARPFSALDDYQTEVLPTFDHAFSALIDDLDARGLLDTTLVVATGEFGRTPRINEKGGRDHWPRVWSAVLAGGGSRGGQVLGASDAHAAEPADRPVTPAELVATLYRGVGLDPSPEPSPTHRGSAAIAGRFIPLAEVFG